MGFIDVDGLSVHYEIVGSRQGGDVVLLHGWGSALDTFDAIVSVLEKNFTVYKLDFPGFGKSEPPKSVWGVNEYTSFIEKFIQLNNILNPIIIGHSFGGRVALLYASRNEVKKLILFNSAGIRPKRPLTYYVKIYAYKLYKRLLPVLIGKARANEKINQYRKRAGSSDYNNAAGIMRSILVKVVNEDLKHVLKTINAPTLLIWGENDTATPVSNAKIMERHIKDCGLVVLKNAGHFSYADKPHDARLIVDNFLTADKIS